MQENDIRYWPRFRLLLSDHRCPMLDNLNHQTLLVPNQEQENFRCPKNYFNVVQQGNVKRLIFKVSLKAQQSTSWETDIVGNNEVFIIKLG